MIPRLKSSKKWTSFPKDYLEQISTLFKENFASQLGDNELILEGRIYTEEIVLRVGYLEKGRLLQANFETSITYSQAQNDAIEKIHNCVDAAASMMQEYFENESELDFPYTWKEVPFKGFKLFLQFSTENTNLEAEANRLLGITEEDLLIEETEDEDALSIAEQSEDLSPPRDEDDYLTEPEDDALLEDDETNAQVVLTNKKTTKKPLH